MTTTRRTFLTNTARLAGGLLIASCAPGGSPAPGQATSSAPKRGGELVIADVSDPQTFDPAFMPVTSGRRLGRMIYDPLVDIDPKGNVIPVLAEKWEYSDPKTLVLSLRKGVKFHFERHLDPKTGSFRRADLLSLDKVTIADSHTVRLQLKTADQAFLAGLFDRPGFILSPNATGKNRDSRPLTVPKSILSDGQRLTLAASSPSNSSTCVARKLGSVRGPAPSWTMAFGSSDPALMMPRGRWYLKLRPTSLTPLASSAEASVSPA